MNTESCEVYFNACGNIWREYFWLFFAIHVVVKRRSSCIV